MVIFRRQKSQGSVIDGAKSERLKFGQTLQLLAKVMNLMSACII